MNEESETTQIEAGGGLTNLCARSRAYLFRRQSSRRCQSAATAKRMSAGMFRDPVFRMMAARWFSTVR